jgi:hypothetical protein
MLKRLARRPPSPSIAISLLALFIALGSTAYAATGGAFLLGRANTASSSTRLTSNNAGTALRVTQQSTATGATALRLNVPAGRPPFAVNSGAKVENLNADKVDGKEAADLQGARAYASFSGWNGSTHLANLFRPKGVIFIVEIGVGHWCVGVNGISAADPGSFAIVSDSHNGAYWQHENSGCGAAEFEIRQYDPVLGVYGSGFTIVIP